MNFFDLPVEDFELDAQTICVPDQPAPKKWLCRLGPWQMEFSPRSVGVYQELSEWAQQKTQHFAAWDDATKNHIASQIWFSMYGSGHLSASTNDIFGRTMRIDPLPLAENLGKFSEVDIVVYPADQPSTVAVKALYCATSNLMQSLNEANTENGGLILTQHIARAAEEMQKILTCYKQNLK